MTATATAAPSSPHHPNRSRTAVLTGLPTNLAAGLRGFAATTPGRLSIAMVGLILLSVLTGIVGIVSGQSRANTLTDLAQHREPVTTAAQQIYRSLSDADATAASAFLSGAVEPQPLRLQYETDIAQAGAALSVAATDGADATNVTDVLTPLTQLSTELPVYTGIVEQAAANNRQGYPVGSAYLREADGLMQSTLLPAAKDLYNADIRSLDAEQDDATSFPWLNAILVVGLIVALLFTQRYLTRRTNRVLNVGLLVATAAVVLALLWSGVGLALSAVYVSDARDSGSAQVALLSQARTDALQARTDEILNLVARGGENYDPQFTKLTTTLGGSDGTGGLLGQVLADSTDDPVMTGQLNAAISTTKKWFALHDSVDTLNNSGNYGAAATQSLDPTSGGEAGTFQALDTALGNAIEQGRTVFVQQTDNAGDALFALPIGVLVLAVLAAAGSTIGIWQRLREYR